MKVTRFYYTQPSPEVAYSLTHCLRLAYSLVPLDKFQAGLPGVSARTLSPADHLLLLSALPIPAPNFPGAAHCIFCAVE